MTIDTAENKTALTRLFFHCSICQHPREYDQKQQIRHNSIHNLSEDSRTPRIPNFGSPPEWWPCHQDIVVSWNRWQIRRYPPSIWLKPSENVGCQDRPAILSPLSQQQNLQDRWCWRYVDQVLNWSGSCRKYFRWNRLNSFRTFSAVSGRGFLQLQIRCAQGWTENQSKILNLLKCSSTGAIQCV